MRPMIDYYPLFIIPIGQVLRVKLLFYKTLLTILLISFFTFFFKFISNSTKKKRSNSLG